MVLKTQARVSIGLMAVLLISGCLRSPNIEPPEVEPTWLESSHEGLAISQVTYTKVLEGFAEAQIQGQISDAQMDNILRIAKGFQGTHNLIVTLLIEYVETIDALEKGDIQVRITALTQSVNSIALELITLLSTYGVSL